MPSLLLTDQKIERIKRELERAKSKPRGRKVQTDYFDQYLRGALVLTASHGGTLAWRLHFRMHGKSNYIGLGRWPTFSLDEARQWARQQLQLVNKGIDPKQASREEKQKREEQAKVERETLFRNVAARFLEQKKRDGLRGIREMERVFELYVHPTFGERQIASVRKSELNRLLRDVGRGECLGPDGKKRGGPKMADGVLTVLSSMMRWYSPQDDSFNMPSFAGMRQTSTAQRARKRILGDDELRALWLLLDRPELGRVFGPILRLLLLSGARKREVSEMGRSEIKDGIWVLPATRTKQKQEIYTPLSPTMLGIIEAQDRIEDSNLIFTNNGRPFQNFGHFKRKLDGLMLDQLRLEAKICGEDEDAVKIEPWVVHDLRRTSRTLLSRAGVSTEVAERTIGHGGRGIEATYNRHKFVEEKRDALAKLEALIMRIVSGPEPDNVVALSPTKERTRKRA